MTAIARARSPILLAAWLLVFAGGFATLLWLNLPGHLSVDSVLGLEEGRFGVRKTWNPAIFGWLLGVLDGLWPGTTLAVALMGLLLFGGWALLAGLRPRVWWGAPVVALGVLALPQTIIYPAIIWKDVLFSASAVMGFVILALGVRDGRPRWVSLAAAALLFAAAGLFRQNGLVLAVPAAIAVAWAAWPSGRGRALGAGGGWLVAVAVLTVVLSAVARPQGPGEPDSSGARGLRILQTYDLTGAAALEPGRPMPVIEAVDPAVAQRLRDAAPQVYTPVRVDVMLADKPLNTALRSLDRDTVRAEWLRLVTGDPGLYLRVRALAFWQVLATPEIDRCLPLHVGVEGPPAALQALEMAPRRSLDDMRLYNYATWYLDTPAMSHLTYGVAAALVFGVLMVRRDPADLVMAAMMLGALGFTTTFFVLSLACDYRYLHFLDVSALTGVLYLALDPSLRKRASQASATSRRGFRAATKR
ncbi:MAG: hypothetical protein U1C74_33925 [Phenylobacterium sp.]|nr:hypothetical protein [Phenylobacterium sp.]